MKIQLVVFDLAGTTVKDNKDVHRMLQAALEESGVAISIDEANAVMGIPKPVAIEKLLRLRKCANLSSPTIQKIHDRFVTKMIDFYKSDPAVSETVGVTDTWKRLKARGIKIAVDTGFDRAITAPLLERLGWNISGLLDASVTSDEVSHGRPSPDLILKAMKLTGVTDARQVAKVGDTAADLQEGTAAGCGLVIGIISGAYPASALAREPHTHLISTIPQLLPVLGIS